MGKRAEAIAKAYREEWDRVLKIERDAGRPEDKASELAGDAAERLLIRELTAWEKESSGV